VLVVADFAINLPFAALQFALSLLTTPHQVAATLIVAAGLAFEDKRPQKGS